MKQIVFIIGMHRCGTSLLANCLIKNGFSIGKTKNKDKNWQNPNGYFENDKFTHFHEKLLIYNNSSWLNINQENMNYTKKHIQEYKNLITNEFLDNKLILIKDPRLTFFTDFLLEVCKDYDVKFLFCTRNKTECCTSLSKAQKKDIKLCETLYEKTQLYYKKKFMKINHNDLIFDNDNTINNILTFVNLNKRENTKGIVDLNLYRNRFYPIEKYPYRIPLDISKVIKKYTENKIVCDLGCGSGDLLEFLKINNFCKDVIGVEITKNRYVKNRKYIINDNMFNIPMPDADVYILWLGGKFPYNKIFERIKSNKIIIYMDSSEDNHKNFEKYNGIKLIEKIIYKYNEEKFVKKDNLKNYIKELKKLQNPNWTIKGERFVKIYKFN
jgi:hypothetical protein